MSAQPSGNQGSGQQSEAGPSTGEPSSIGKGKAPQREVEEEEEISDSETTRERKEEKLPFHVPMAFEEYDKIATQMPNRQQIYHGPTIPNPLPPPVPEHLKLGSIHPVPEHKVLKSNAPPLPRPRSPGMETNIDFSTTENIFNLMVQAQAIAPTLNSQSDTGANASGDSETKRRKTG